MKKKIEKTKSTQKQKRIRNQLKDSSYTAMLKEISESVENIRILIENEIARKKKINCKNKEISKS